MSLPELSRLFEKAVALSPEDRVPYLDRVCKGDAPLRAELERLLAADDRAKKEDFMRNPALQWSSLTNSESPIVFPPGQKIADRYRIVRFLGEGGMGQVYQAKDEVLNCFVALKTIRPEIASDASTFDRFKKEVRLAHEVAHENVCRVFDLDHRNLPPFLTMEFIEGETLAARLRSTEGKKMTTSVAFPLIEQMAQALNAAHQKGVIHGDFKPGNVMLTQAGAATHATITDFGLARTTGGEGSLTSAHPAGTPSYMAPEQLAGGKATVASDIYALGLVMYEMVTGEKPEFNRITEPAPSPRRHAPELDSKWNDAIRRCLARDPASRFTSAIDVVAAIRGEGLPVGWIARILSRVRNPVRPLLLEKQMPAGRSANEKSVVWRLVIACTALIVLAAATYFGWSLYDRYWHDAPFREIQITRLTTNGKAARAAISPDGKYLAYVHYDLGQQSLWVSQIATSASVMLIPPASGAYGEPAFSPDSSQVYFVKYDETGHSALYSIPALGGATRRVIADVNGFSAVSPSPDGKRVAFIRTNAATGEDAIMIVEADSGKVRKLTGRKSPDALMAVAWSPDGKTIACDALVYDSAMPFARIFAIPAGGGTERPLTSTKLYTVTGLAWLPDGRNLILNAFESPRWPSQLWTMFVPDGKPRRITNNLEMYRGLSVSGDGSLVTVQQRTSSSIWIAPDGKVERSTHFAIIADQDSFGLSWAPDGRILHSRYGSGGNTEIWLTDRDGGRAQQLLAGPGHNIWPRVSSDQRYVVFVSDRTGTPHLWRIDLDGGNLQQLTQGTGERQFDLSPDGQWVYFSSGEHDTLRLRKIGIQGGSQVQLSDEPAGWPSVSADGRLIALDVTVGHPAKRTIAILPAEGGRAVKRLSIDSWTQIPFRWTLDGKALLYVRDGDGPSNNVWRQPLNGGPPAPATNFTGDEEVFWFDLASDGKQLACMRGMTAYDAVSIRGVR